MGDSADVHIGENSPQQVAFKLMQTIANTEGRSFVGHGDNPVTREWIIRTYCVCLKAVREPDYPADALALGQEP